MAGKGGPFVCVKRVRTKVTTVAFFRLLCSMYGVGSRYGTEYVMCIRTSILVGPVGGDLHAKWLRFTGVQVLLCSTERRVYCTLYVSKRFPAKPWLASVLPN
jgi:hypothetical protein